MKKRIAVLFGGFSAERHVSVESGRNVYEKLEASSLYEPIAVFLAGSEEDMRFFMLPINCFLKDNADDIANTILNHKSRQKQSSLDLCRQRSLDITTQYGIREYEATEINFCDLKNLCDFVFIALHGHPGEDGVIQKKLEHIDLPYNGSDPGSSFIMMSKFLTHNFLKEQNFNVAKQISIKRQDFLDGNISFYHEIETYIKYPCIAKPVNDGCSAGVKKILNKQDLDQYLIDNFKKSALRRDEILIEEFIVKGDAKIFIEVTCGLLTHYANQEEILYEIFTPSESIAADSVLSLEEKFLAGQGKNITPARFSFNIDLSNYVMNIVKEEIKRAAIALNILGYARIDAFVKIFADNKVEVWIIEANSLPALTPATCIFHQCILNGYKPVEFLSKIIEFGLHKHIYDKKV